MKSIKLLDMHDSEQLETKQTYLNLFALQKINRFFFLSVFPSIAASRNSTGLRAGPSQR